MIQDAPLHCPVTDEATEIEKLICDAVKAPKPKPRDGEVQPLSGGGGGDQPPKKPPVPSGD